MIIQLNKHVTELSKLQEIPSSFFAKVEAAKKFDESLFPDWFDEVFGTTKNRKDGLYKKFEALYKKYKEINDKDRRLEIVQAYTDGIQVEKLCNREAGVSAKKLSEFPEIKDAMRTVLKHLWDNSLTYNKFEAKAKTNVHDYVTDFIKNHNEISVCPFCGIEGYVSLEGQSRLPLDHWMCKEKYPYSYVNFDNLVPIGSKCNESPAKGAKDVTVLTKTGRAFYPFTKHNSISVEITTTKTPTNPVEENGVYSVIVKPKHVNDQDIFESWDKLFNIKTNYNSFFQKHLQNSWRSKYKAYIDKSKKLVHAETVDEFKSNLEFWQESFQSLILPGALVFSAFVENLLTQPNAYLHGLMEYFRKQ